MAHKTQQELTDLIHQAAEQVTLDGLYCHYKNPSQLYRVTQLVIREATEEVDVVYEARYGPRISYTRPLRSWLDMVEYEGRSVRRFQQIQPA
jgi:hypothetical protein